MNNNQKVSAVVQIITGFAQTPEEALDILVPVVAAAMAHVKAEPADIEAFFFRVTTLLDVQDSKTNG